MALDADLRKNIIQAVSDGFEDQIAFTQDLVRMPSLRGHEHPVQDLLHRTLQSRGYAMDRFQMDREAIAAHPGGSKISEHHSDAPIVVGIHRPRDEKGRSLILQSHLDVVPEGLHDMWSDPPFSGKIDGDWMYGRGAGDMKAGAAANIFALDALRRIGLQPAATVYIQSVVEEESTGNGALQTYLQGYTADAVFIPEPEEEMLVRANVGVLWFQVQLRGVPKHVREMGAGANAIDAATRVTALLREIEAEWNADKAGRPHFKDEANITNCNIGKIEGGDWASSVPSWCNIDCRISIYPGRSADDAAAEITDRIAAFAASDGFLSNNPPKVVFNGFYAEGYVLEEGTEAEAVLGRAHEAATGASLKSFMSPSYLDTRVYALYNKIPALCYGPISRNIHGIDECVSLPSVQRITASLALFIAEWCGVEATGD
ncbi:MAG TPA: ArgE/DapE family deacylase [Roseovarius sp.]